MKIAVAGPGGVGAYYGGLLARGGMDVTFLGRGKHLEALKTEGLRVKSYKGDFHINVKAGDNPSETGICDLILFCVKSFDTKEVAQFIAPMVGTETIIISLQNGVDNEEQLGQILGMEKVMAGVAFIGSRMEEPGLIVHSAAGSITFGEIEGGLSERGEKVCRTFQSCGIEARLSEDIKKVMWQKMVWNCGFNAITALTGCAVSNILSDKSTREVVQKAMEEVVDLAQGLGIAVSRDLPQKTIAHTEKQGEIKTSMLMDMEKGRRMEIEALNGAVSKRGKELKRETPVNDTLYSMVRAINKKRGF
ncbi:MAG: ketopantoate reductase family protein [Deltaproteobacteria bacterium]|nr:ketopantoate reductase family protein [Deltaproteobacteria bacterium]